MIVSYPAGQVNGIAVYDGLIDKKVCDDLIILLRPIYDQVSSDGRTMGGVIPATKCSRDTTLSQVMFNECGANWTTDLQSIETHIHDCLSQAIAHYRATFTVLNDWRAISDTGYQIQMYPRIHGHYRSHIDSLPGSETGDRVLAAIVYLNSVSNGGHTHFNNHDISIEPQVGRLLIFPALWPYPHEGQPALSDDKWIINTFIINTEQADKAHHDHIGSDHEH